MIKVEIRQIETPYNCNGKQKWYDTEKTVKIFGITVLRKRHYFPEGIGENGNEAYWTFDL